MSAALNPEQLAAHNRDFGYAGDVTVADAWELLKRDGNAVIVDVRTPHEWEQVGVPDVSGLGKELLLQTWKMLPDGSAGRVFAEEFSLQPIAKDSPLLLLCKAGGRSQAAAIALTSAGYTCCLNVAGGFEGQGGWKAAQLPAK